MPKTSSQPPTAKSHPAGICRVCGCEHEIPCPGGCGWTDHTQTLCTSCQALPDELRHLLAVLAAKCADAPGPGWWFSASALAAALGLGGGHKARLLLEELEERDVVVYECRSDGWMTFAAYERWMADEERKS